MNVLLSVCIPTFNRKNFLKDCIISIIDSIPLKHRDLVEICISDNASDDGTAELVQQMILQNDVKIRYAVNTTNLGPDVNILKCVDMATGTYSWIMGSDDMMTPESITTVFNYLQKTPDILLFDRFNCDFSMRKCETHSFLSFQADESFNLSTQSELDRYARHTLSLAAGFSYISSVVFLRSRWREISVPEVIMGLGYPHVFILLSFIKENCEVTYIKRALVKNRMDNDSFMSAGKAGAIDRIMLDVVGYGTIAEAIFGQHIRSKKSILKILHAERSPIHIVPLVRLHSNEESWTRHYKAFKIAGYPFWLLSFASYSRGLLKILRLIYKLLK